jgi:aminoglycoside phosphotransferase (APT) family kinase protein
MTAASNGLPPERARLETVLRTMLDDQSLAVIDRSPLERGTFPKEIVRCRNSDSEVIELFCKYSSRHGTQPGSPAAHHRYGLAHEVQVYRDLLGPMGVTVPALRGALDDPGRPETWLVLDYMADGTRLNKSPDPGAMPAAAGWIAALHSACEQPSGPRPTGLLTTYDATYYLGWAERTYERCVALRIGPPPWLEPLCQGFGSAVSLLRAAPQVIIHGEYYPKNILIRDGTIYPVDWESAAIGPGEIDLASLTEAWPAEVVAACVARYREVRPATESYDFAATLDAARLYITFRWLGDPDLAPPDPGRLESLRASGERLRLI